MANRPPALFVSEYVTALRSDADAVIPTVVPLAACSATLLGVGSASTGVPGTRSATAMLKTADTAWPAASAACTVIR